MTLYFPWASIRSELIDLMMCSGIDLLFFFNLKQVYPLQGDVDIDVFHC